MKYTLRILFVSLGFVCLLSACKKETNTPSVINTQLNLRYSNGDYVPTELQNLPIDQSYDLTLKAKHYTSAVFSNKKIYFQNEVIKVHYFVLN